MKAIQDIPRWALILIVSVLSLGAKYGVDSHLEEDQQQSADIKALTVIVSGLVEATENLKTVTENNRAEHRWLHSE